MQAVFLQHYTLLPFQLDYETSVHVYVITDLVETYH